MTDVPQGSEARNGLTTTFNFRLAVETKVERSKWNDPIKHTTVVLTKGPQCTEQIHRVSYKRQVAMTGPIGANDHRRHSESRNHLLENPCAPVERDRIHRHGLSGWKIILN